MPIEFPDAGRPLLLNKLTLPAPLTLCVLAPHPDDFDAIGVTLRFFHERGDVIHVAVLTTGASGVEDGFGSADNDAQKAALREEEQKASCRFFGLLEERLSFLRLPLEDKSETPTSTLAYTTLSAYLRARQPDLVFMPHGNDSNAAHRRSYELLRAVAQHEHLELWAGLNRDAKTIAMRHDLVTAFTEEEANWKARMLRLHTSQQQRNLNTRGHGFDERVLQINRDSAQGLSLDATYAEIFEMERFPKS